MRRVLVAFLMALLPDVAAAQGFDFGVGLGAPVSGRTMVISAVNDSAGVTHALESLDSSPQLLFEIHREWGFGQSGYGIGPALVFAPSFTTTASSNAANGQPIGGGFGLVLSMPTHRDANGQPSDSRKLNLLIAWMMHPAQPFMGAQWRDGFQAPRDRDNQPIAPQFPKRSASRAYVGVTVSGIF